MVYYVNGWPSISNHSVGSLNNVVHICSTTDWFTVVTQRSITFHDQRDILPCFEITIPFESSLSGEQLLSAFWLSDYLHSFIVTTVSGKVILFDVPESSGSIRRYKNKTERECEVILNTNSSDAIQYRFANLGIPLVCACAYANDFLVSSATGVLTVFHWELNSNLDVVDTLSLNEIPFYNDIEHSRTRCISDNNTYCHLMEWAPTLGGIMTILSSGDVALLYFTEVDGKWVSEGILAERYDSPVSLAVNHRFRTVAVGANNTKIALYRMDETTGAILVQQCLSISDREFPDASNIVGPAAHLAWSSDGCALAVAWKNCGWALWSVFGGLLFTSLGESMGLGTRVKLSHLSWSTDGYHLAGLMSFPRSKSDLHSAAATTPMTESFNEDGSHKSDHANMAVGESQLVVFHMVRSALTTNPTTDNHRHILLQAEDRLFFAKGNSTNLITIPLPSTYVNHNWPIQYAGVDRKGDRIAISGEFGLSHYNGRTKRWHMFGNEAQERAMQVCGGLAWWADHVALCCYESATKNYEIRIYHSGRRLDDRSASVLPLLGSKSPLLVDCLDDLFTVLTSDGRVRIVRFVESESTVRIDPVQLIDVCSLIIYPVCVVRLCLSSLSTKFANPIEERSSSSPNTHSGSVESRSDDTSTLASTIAHTSLHSLIVNYAGYLFILQADRTSQLPSSSSSTQVGIRSGKKPLLLIPFHIASNVELVWPTVEQNENCAIDSPNTPPAYLCGSLWLYCGSQGLKVWLPLSNLSAISPALRMVDFVSTPARSPPDRDLLPFTSTNAGAGHGSAITPGYLSRRIMLSLELDECVYPLTIPFHNAVLVAVSYDFHCPPNLSDGKQGDVGDMMENVYTILPYGSLNLETHTFLPRIIQELLRKNLGTHALQLSSAYQHLPHFHRVLEWLLHEVLEAEATSKLPIPDPLLPQVIAFIQEFPNFLETVAQCARKTEMARWSYLFTAVGRRPKDLFELAIECGNLNVATSYLMILQAYEPCAQISESTLRLVQFAVDSSQWGLVRELIRFFNAIDPDDLNVPTSDSMRIRPLTVTTPTSSVDFSMVLNTFRPPTTSGPLQHQTTRGFIQNTDSKVPKTPTSVLEVNSIAPKLTLVDMIYELLHQNAASCLARGHLKKMAELIINCSTHTPSTDFQADFVLAKWIACQKSELHHVPNWPASLLHLHHQFNQPLPLSDSDVNKPDNVILDNHGWMSKNHSLDDPSIRQLYNLLGQLLQAGSYEWASLLSMILHDQTGLMHAITLAMHAAADSTLERFRNLNIQKANAPKAQQRKVEAVAESEKVTSARPSLSRYPSSNSESTLDPFSPHSASGALIGDPFSRVLAGLEQLKSWSVHQCPPYHAFLLSIGSELDRAVEQTTSFYGRFGPGLVDTPTDKYSTLLTTGLQPQLHEEYSTVSDMHSSSQPYNAGANVQLVSHVTLAQSHPEPLEISQSDTQSVRSDDWRLNHHSHVVPSHHQYNEMTIPYCPITSSPDQVVHSSHMLPTISHQFRYQKPLPGSAVFQSTTINNDADDLVEPEDCLIDGTVDLPFHHPHPPVNLIKSDRGCLLS